MELKRKVKEKKKKSNNKINITFFSAFPSGAETPLKPPGNLVIHR